jgi:hypothetical protein
LAIFESEIVPFPLMTTVEVPPTKRPEALPMSRSPPMVRVEEPADQLPPDSETVPEVVTAADWVIVPVKDAVDVIAAIDTELEIVHAPLEVPSKLAVSPDPGGEPLDQLDPVLHAPVPIQVSVAAEAIPPASWRTRSRVRIERTRMMEPFT